MLLTQLITNSMVVAIHSIIYNRQFYIFSANFIFFQPIKADLLSKFPTSGNKACNFLKTYIEVLAMQKFMLV
jgi:hypothetical protein